MSSVPTAPLRKLSIIAVVLASWDAMKLRAANPLAGWQACLEAEAQPPIGARLAARQGQAGQSVQQAPANQQSAFKAPAQAPAFGHASFAPKTVPGRPAPMDAARQSTGSLLHLPQLSTLLNEDPPRRRQHHPTGCS